MARPFLFIALVYALTAPWWWLSRYAQLAVLPDHLPVTDVGAAFMPALAAILLCWRDGGASSVRTVLRRIGDAGRVQGTWWLVILALPPVIYGATALLMRARGEALPAMWGVTPALLGTFAVFFAGAVGEELGYTGYATDPLLTRHSTGVTGVLLGVPWALWHLPSMIQIGQSTPLILWGLAATVASRVIHVTVYARAGRSLFAIILLHALMNTGRTAFPGGRAGFEQGDAAVGYGLLIVLACAAAWLGAPAAKVAHRH